MIRLKMDQFVFMKLIAVTAVTAVTAACTKKIKKRWGVYC